MYQYDFLFACLIRAIILFNIIYRVGLILNSSNVAPKKANINFYQYDLKHYFLALNKFYANIKINNHMIIRL